MKHWPLKHGKNLKQLHCVKLAIFLKSEVKITQALYFASIVNANKSVNFLHNVL